MIIDGVPVGKARYRTMKVGAGGYVTGQDFAGDYHLCRTDVFGAYIRHVDDLEWKQVCNARSLIEADRWAAPEGVYEIRFAPSNPNVIWMAGGNGKVYRSINRARTWTHLSALATITTDDGRGMANGVAARYSSHKGAVDPIDPDVFLLGTQDEGLHCTFDAGQTWLTHEDVPVATGNTGYRCILVAFDPSSAVVSGRTQGIYALSYGNGLYRSQDGGVTFAHVSGSPTQGRSMRVHDDGTVAICEYAEGWSTSTAYKAGAFIMEAGTGNHYTCLVDHTSAGSGTFADYRTANPTHWSARRFGSVTLYDGATLSWLDMSDGQCRVAHMAVNPLDSDHWVGVMDSGDLNVSADGGVNWTGPMWGQKQEDITPDIPWLAAANNAYMSNGGGDFQPGTDRFVQPAGLGVFYIDGPPTTSTAYAYTSLSAGIEELVGNTVLHPPGGYPIAFAWDRPTFRITDPDAYPSAHGPEMGTAISHGWAGDYAGENPLFIVALNSYSSTENSSWSDDGGITWTPFATSPIADIPNGWGGCIACADEDNFLVAPSRSGGGLRRTHDRGDTWHNISLPGHAGSGETGLGWMHYFRRYIVLACKINIGTYYAYFYPVGGNEANTRGVYKSTDFGVNWSRVYDQAIGAWTFYSTKLRGVFDRPLDEDMWFTAGPQLGDSIPLYRSQNGGVSWDTIPNVTEVWDIAFGAPAPEHDYPAIYIVGRVSDELGIWRSIDEATTWVKLSTITPFNHIDAISGIEANKDVFGEHYLSFGGSGFGIGEYALGCELQFA
jgi:hypothetical protein